MDAMGIVVILGLCLFVGSILLVFVAIFSIRQSAKDDEQAKIWEEIAEPLGWTFDRKRREMIGSHRGKLVKVDNFEQSRSILGLLYVLLGFQAGRGDQAMSQISGRIRVRMKVSNPSNCYMSLAGKSTRSSVENLIFKQEETMLEEIDSLFSVESKPKNFAPDVLKSKQLRDQLMGLYQYHPISLAISKDELNLQVQGLSVDGDSIQRVITLASDVAEAIELLVVER